MWTVGSARVKAANDGLVVIVEPYAEGRSPVSPGTGGQCNGVQLCMLCSNCSCDHRPLNHKHWQKAPSR